MKQISMFFLFKTAENFVICQQLSKLQDFLPADDQ